MTYDRANRLISRLDPDRLDVATSLPRYRRTDAVYDGAGERSASRVANTASYRLPVAPAPAPTWASVAQTLYGTSAVATQLEIPRGFPRPGPPGEYRPAGGFWLANGITLS